MVTQNGNDVIAPTAQAATPAITFLSLSSDAKWLFFFLPLSVLLGVLVVVGVVVFVDVVVVGVVLVVGVVVVGVLFKSLHLVEICTLTCTF